ncbi:hypothetical protein MKW98_010913 [Papaver atlanticum]|uniref:Uncharacterized protein n=1 Tax=Papaver atlanticum TaxID=357466 RepID=A0AAD4SMB5_9MAGN|nr:hypothetical protein MKW98_010913 [Papaver atlanticum]
MLVFNHKILSLNSTDYGRVKNCRCLILSKDWVIVQPEPVLVNGTSESITAAAQELGDTIAPIAEELSNGVEVHHHLNNEEEVVMQEEVEEPPQVQPVQIEVRQLTKPAGPMVQEDASKKSYAAG